MDEPQSPYDKLYLWRVICFVALILLCNTMIVIAAYTFLWEKPFHTVLTAERAKFGGVLNYELHENMRYNGDKTYDVLFVKTGVEKTVYDELKNAREDDVAADAIKKLRMFDSIIDNVFDYLLLLSYRFGFFTVLFAYFACIVGALAVHGAVIRHRKRYGFGDTPILMNLWARSTLAYAIPFTFLVWTLPFAMSPIFLTLSLASCILGLAIFAFSLPKVA